MKKTVQEKLATLSKRKLAELRKEIVLDSLFLRDYKNSLGLDENAVYYFFEGYSEMLYLDVEEEEREKGVKLSDLDAQARHRELDNLENLVRWQGLYMSGIAQ